MPVVEGGGNAAGVCGGGKRYLGGRLGVHPCQRTGKGPPQHSKAKRDIHALKGQGGGGENEACLSSAQELHAQNCHNGMLKCKERRILILCHAIPARKRSGMGMHAVMELAQACQEKEERRDGEDRRAACHAGQRSFQHIKLSFLLPRRIEREREAMLVNAMHAWPVCLLLGPAMGGAGHTPLPPSHAMSPAPCSPQQRHTMCGGPIYMEARFGT